MNDEDKEKYHWARRISDNDDISNDNAIKVFKIWQDLSHKGYIRSTFRLGVCYDLGIGVKEDKRKAYCCYIEAAEEGNSDAAYNVYRMLYNGDGVKKSLDDAVYWLRKCIDFGDIEAYRDLGYHYYYGIGLESDYCKAADCYRKAAENGDQIAQWNLGLCYIDGHGVSESKKFAHYWISEAAFSGHEKAKKFLEDEKDYFLD